MRRLLFLLAGLLVAYLILDYAARAFVASRVEAEFRDADRVQADGVDFSINSFPFLARLGLLGEVSATLELQDVGQDGATLDAFVVEIDNLVFDRDRAFHGHVLVSGLDRATVTARLEQDTLSDLLGVPVDLPRGGRAADFGIELQVADEGLVIIAGGRQEVISFPAADYFPCDPDVEFHPGRLELTCSTEELPPIVNQVIGQAARRA